MDVADAQQRIDVRVVGVLAERVDEEKDRRDPAFGDLRGDLRVTAERAGEHPLDMEADLFVDEAARRACADEVIALQDIDMSFCKGDHLVFFVVMGDESDGFAFGGQCNLLNSNSLQGKLISEVILPASIQQRRERVGREQVIKALIHVDGFAVMGFQF